MVPPRSATPSEWLRGQWGGVLKVRLRWQEVVLVASALRKVQLEGREKKTGWGQQTKSGFQRRWGQKLTFDELDHFLVGHGGHERAVHLEKERSSYVSGAEKQKDGRQSRAVARAGHLYDSVPFLDPGLDRRAARPDILDQLDPLPADGEAEAQLVLLHDHASLDETRTWDGHMLTISAI